MKIIFFVGAQLVNQLPGRLLLNIKNPAKRAVVFDKVDFSTYYGVIVSWEDYDTRIFTFIDSLPENVRNELAICQERKGDLYLGWKEFIPAGYEANKAFIVDSDEWTVMKSEICQGLKILRLSL